MTSCEKNDSILRAFGIPVGDDAAADGVRAVLSRLLSARALRLADLQTARDIAERADVKVPEVYLFLAAMFVSSGKGNAYMEDSAVADLLVAGGYLDDPMKLGFTESNDAYGTRLKELCQALSGVAWKTKLENDVLQREEDRWYFQRDRTAVQDLSRTLTAFASAEPLGPAPQEGLLERAAKFDFELNAAQKAALKAAVTQRFTVITGGPGTGKTTTVCAILRALLMQNPDWTVRDIALAAPTGRAAQRMQEAILAQCRGLEGEKIAEIAREIEGSTVHRLIGGYAPKWKHDEKHKLERKVVIVDETSMVDLYLMQALLKALDRKTRLILLGDADQLPSVETGAVLGDLTGIGIDARIVKRLEVCERAKGEVLDVSKAINDCGEKDVAALVASWSGKKILALPETSAAPAEGASEFRWLEPKADITRQEIMEFHSKWMSGCRLAELARAFESNDPAFSGLGSESSKALFGELNRRRILTLVREGRYGVKEANAHLLKEAKRAAEKPYADYLSLVGIPIMVTKNTPERKLFNGDVGVTVKGPNGMVVLFPRGQKTVACPVALLPEHELAYAMTVHKSQGSEFENVMVVLPDDARHPLLTRQIVYTGITRAKKRAVVMGTEDALKTAISHCIVRNTGVVCR